MAIQVRYTPDTRLAEKPMMPQPGIGIDPAGRLHLAAVEGVTRNIQRLTQIRGMQTEATRADAKSRVAEAFAERELKVRHNLALQGFELQRSNLEGRAAFSATAIDRRYNQEVQAIDLQRRGQAINREKFEANYVQQQAALKLRKSELKLETIGAIGNMAFAIGEAAFLHSQGKSALAVQTAQTSFQSHMGPAMAEINASIDAEIAAGTLSREDATEAARSRYADAAAQWQRDYMSQMPSSTTTHTLERIADMTEAFVGEASARSAIQFTRRQAQVEADTARVNLANDIAAGIYENDADGLGEQIGRFAQAGWLSPQQGEALRLANERYAETIGPIREITSMAATSPAAAARAGSALMQSVPARYARDAGKMVAAPMGNVGRNLYRTNATASATGQSYEDAARASGFEPMADKLPDTLKITTTPYDNTQMGRQKHLIDVQEAMMRASNPAELAVLDSYRAHLKSDMQNRKDFMELGVLEAKAAVESYFANLPPGETGVNARIATANGLEEFVTGAIGELQIGPLTLDRTNPRHYELALTLRDIPELRAAAALLKQTGAADAIKDAVWANIGQVQAKFANDPDQMGPALLRIADGLEAMMGPGTDRKTHNAYSAGQGYIEQAIQDVYGKEMNIASLRARYEGQDNLADLRAGTDDAEIADFSVPELSAISHAATDQALGEIHPSEALYDQADYIIRQHETPGGAVPVDVGHVLHRQPAIIEGLRNGVPGDAVDSIRTLRLLQGAAPAQFNAAVKDDPYLKSYWLGLNAQYGGSVERAVRGMDESKVTKLGDDILKYRERLQAKNVNPELKERNDLLLSRDGLREAVKEPIKHDTGGFFTTETDIPTLDSDEGESLGERFHKMMLQQVMVLSQKHGPMNVAFQGDGDFSELGTRQIVQQAKTQAILLNPDADIETLAYEAAALAAPQLSGVGDRSWYDLPGGTEFRSRTVYLPDKYWNGQPVSAQATLQKAIVLNPNGGDYVIENSPIIQRMRDNIEVLNSDPDSLPPNLGTGYWQARKYMEENGGTATLALHRAEAQSGKPGVAMAIRILPPVDRGDKAHPGVKPLAGTERDKPSYPTSLYETKFTMRDTIQPARAFIIPLHAYIETDGILDGDAAYQRNRHVQRKSRKALTQALEDIQD